MAGCRVHKNKRTVKPQKLTKIKGKKDKIPRNKKGHFKKGYHRDKPKGAVSLKTRIFNDILASYYDKKVEGTKLIRELPQGSRGVKQYLDYIVTLIKGNNDDHPHKIDLTIKLGGSSGTKGS